MKFKFLLLTSSMYLVNCVPPPHPLVVATRQEEEFLPIHLRSPALHNPHLQEILPLTSLLHKGEKPVYERDTDTIPRRKIYNILTHAGLVSRKQFYQQYVAPHQNRVAAAQHQTSSKQIFHDPPFYPSPELLQYL